jgi:RHS repeat-associated protein
MTLNPAGNGSNYMAMNESGDKYYELSNHLGNVLNVVTDRKIPVEGTGGSAGTVAYYDANVLSYSDYYPFGMVMPGRDGSSSEYRYGYQGSEKDNEVKGEGNSYTTHYRQLDVRTGRWLTLDPKAQSMPWQSPYCSMDNNPAVLNDINGDKVKVKGNRHERKEIKAAIETARKESTTFDNMYTDLENSREKFIYTPGESHSDFSKKDIGGGGSHEEKKPGVHIITIEMAPLSNINGRVKGAKIKYIKLDEGITVNPTELLGHETAHAWLDLHNLIPPVQFDAWHEGSPMEITAASWNASLERRTKHEIEASHIENLIRIETNRPLRVNYGTLQKANVIWSKEKMGFEFEFEDVNIPAQKSNYDYKKKEHDSIHKQYNVKPIEQKGGK